MSTRTIELLCAIALAASATACSGNEVVPPKTAPLAIAAIAAPSQAPRAATQGTLHVDDAISKACGLPVPRFDFDSSRIDGQAASALDAIANCFTKGPLSGRSMRLVGHADPRGEFDYNLALGQRRAGSVRSYVESKGLPGDRISTTSRGALDAVGVDEAGWASDRRVDLVLTN